MTTPSAPGAPRTALDRTTGRAQALRVAGLCAALVLGMTGFMSFAAMYPLFEAEWSLSGSAGGAVAAAYFAGNIVAALVLVSATDRIDARAVALAGAAISAVAQAGFALAASGVASACAWRALAGVGLAGLFMPGLRALLDRIDASIAPRAVAFYTAHFAVGAAASFVLAGELAARLGWRAATLALAAAPASALVLLGAALAGAARPPAATAAGSMLANLRAAWGNRAARTVSLAYATHGAEMVAFRAWSVAAVAMAALHHAPGSPGAALALTPAQLAGLAALVGLPGSLIGTEIARRVGLERTIAASMLGAALAALAVAAAMFAHPVLLAAAMLAYGFAIMTDTGTLTMAMMSLSDKPTQGAQMALHNVMGSAGSLAGPLVAGVVLDVALTRLAPQAAWAVAFAALAAVSLGGCALMRRAWGEAARVHVAPAQARTASDASGAMPSGS